MREYYFTESISVGEQGEDIIINYLKQLSHIEQVVDVRDNPTFRNMDIDVAIKTKTGDIVSMEIKTDTYDTGNLFYETHSCIERNSIGCMLKTSADYILYYFMKTHELYILKTQEFREWVQSKEYNFQKKQLKNVRHDLTTYTSQGYLIPKRYLEGSFNNYCKITVKG